MKKEMKPVHLAFDEGVSSSEQRVTLEGIAKMLSIAGLTRSVQVRNFGVWREPDYKQGNLLVARKSVDWYVAEAQRLSDRTEQLHAGRLLELCWNETYQRDSPHYDVFVTSRDFYDDGTNWIFGCAFTGFGMVVSTHRPRLCFPGDRNALTRHETLKTGVMHEFGHVLGLPNGKRGRNLTESLGTHCTNRCIMRQELAMGNWPDLTLDRLRHGPLCDDCLADLHAGIADERSWR